ncbi:MAG: 3',5'-nucleoside bisphosphate phosphatase [Pseudomonadota bacterium]|nr:3',5'-nucleoside bisphosphate phosphatase [Pseudomonadota bacterium]
MTIYDLHCHSTASDGVLSPRELVHRANEKGVHVLALTDHDELSGQAEAATVAQEAGLRLIHGVEISVTWGNVTLHVVGLNVDPQDPVLLNGLARNRGGRSERARRIGEDLARLGIAGAFEGASALAENKELISRTHFARFLIERGIAKNMKSVFKKYLVKGKPGYVTHEWASLNDALTWIHAAGGVAVLAHPGRYQIGREKMRLLLSEFKHLGGAGIEVVTGSHTQDQVPLYADLAVEFDLMASIGSDFHAPGEGGRELGRLTALPERCRPIWQAWN